MLYKVTNVHTGSITHDLSLLKAAELVGIDDRELDSSLRQYGVATTYEHIVQYEYIPEKDNLKRTVVIACVVVVSLWLLAILL